MAHRPLCRPGGVLPSAARRPADPWDYFHVNAITIDPTDNNLVISGRNACACYKVDRSTGRVIWKLGGKHSDFRMGREAASTSSTTSTCIPGGVMTLFDNEAGPPQEASQSRGLVLAVDERRGRSAFTREFHHRPPVLSAALAASSRWTTATRSWAGAPPANSLSTGPIATVLFDGA